MVFNIVARNRDDHVKNIAFLMNPRGERSPAPAFDVTYAFNPEGEWTRQYQMSVAGKRDGFTRQDLRACGRTASLRSRQADTIIDQVREAVSRWDVFAVRAGGSRQHAVDVDAFSLRTDDRPTSCARGQRAGGARLKGSPAAV